MTLGDLNPPMVANKPLWGKRANVVLCWYLIACYSKVCKPHWSYSCGGTLHAGYLYQSNSGSFQGTTTACCL